MIRKAKIFKPSAQVNKENPQKEIRRRFQYLVDEEPLRFVAQPKTNWSIWLFIRITFFTIEGYKPLTQFDT